MHVSRHPWGQDDGKCLPKLGESSVRDAVCLAGSSLYCGAKSMMACLLSSGIVATEDGNVVARLLPVFAFLDCLLRQ